MTNQELESLFTYHPPKNDEQKFKYETIRNEAKSFALYLNTTLPDSREKSLAITKLQEAVMWANASIVVHS